MKSFQERTQFSKIMLAFQIELYQYVDADDQVSSIYQETIMFKVILQRGPNLPKREWLDRTYLRAVQRAASLAVLHGCPYQVDSQGNYVVKASSWYAISKQSAQQAI
jgi:hypothetical protein